jgi:hypothetical protein
VYNKHINNTLKGLEMFTDKEKEFLLHNLICQKNELEQHKEVAEMNDRRFTMQDELDIVNSLIQKLEK